VNRLQEVKDRKARRESQVEMDLQDYLVLRVKMGLLVLEEMLESPDCRVPKGPLANQD